MGWARWTRTHRFCDAIQNGELALPCKSGQERRGASPSQPSLGESAGRLGLSRQTNFPFLSYCKPSWSKQSHVSLSFYLILSPLCMWMFPGCSRSTTDQQQLNPFVAGPSCHITSFLPTYQGSFTRPHVFPQRLLPPT